MIRLIRSELLKIRTTNIGGSSPSSLSRPPAWRC